MKTFLCLLVLGLAFGDKLDRTYLPPPGSKYAGGQPGDLQVPLEFPKESYTTTAPYTLGKNNERPSITGGPATVQGFAPSGPTNTEQSNDLVPVTPASKPQSSFFGNTYKVPTTTTSYAFTQTTTFPPTESFATTPSLIGPGFSNNISLNQQPGFVNQPFGHGQFFNQQTGQYRPGFVQPGNQIVQEPGFIPTSTSTIPGILNSFPNNNNIIPGSPGYTDVQNINQYQHFPSSTISPVLGNSFAPGLTTYYNQENSQYQGVLPPRQFTQKDFIPSTTGAPGYFYPSPNENISINQEASIFGQQSSLASEPNAQQGATQYNNKYLHTQTANPARSQLGQQQYEGDLNAIPGTTGPAISSQQGPRSGEIQGTRTEIAPGQQNHTDIKVFTGQQDYQSPEQYQAINIPGNVQRGQNQQFGGLQPYLPDRGNLQYEQDLLESGIPKVTATPTGYFGNQAQPPQFSRVNAIPPSTVIPQEFTPGTISQQQLNGQQPKYTGQQNIFPSNLSPESQNINDQFQSHDQQSIFSSTGIPQEPTAFGQTNFQNSYNQPESTRQSFPSQSNIQPGLYQPIKSVNDVEESYIPGANALSNGKILAEPSVGQNPKYQNTITASGLQNNYGTSTTRPTTALPFNYQQSFSSTPETLAPYGTTPTGIYDSSTPLYQGAISPVIPERPQAEADRNAVILNYESILTPDGYAYSFDTSNGIHADENGTTIDGTKANGSYSYIGDDGKLYSVVYTADENGFRPHGDHLPTPPPIPEGIQRVIEQAAKDKEAGILHDGFYDEAKYGHKKYRGHKDRYPATEEKIINGADIPENSNDVTVNLSDQKGGKKSLPNKYSPRYKNKDNVPETDDTVLYPPSQNNILQRPKSNTRGKVEINFDQDEDLITGSDELTQEYPIKQQMQRKKPNEDSVKLNSGRRGKPMSSKVINQYQFSKDNNDEIDNTYDNEKYKKNPNDKLPESDGRHSSNTFNSNIENTQKRMKLSGPISSDENTKIRQKQKVKRPGSSKTQVEDDTYDIDTTITTDNELRKPSKGPSKTFGTKYYVTDKSSENLEEYEEHRLMEEQKYFFVKPNNTTKKGPTKNSLRSKTYDSGAIRKLPNLKQQGKTSEDESIIRHGNDKSSDRETGYEYIPPKNKLMDQKKNYMFPSRFSDTVTKKQPVMKYSLSDKKSTVKPFITPNVHRDEDEDNTEYEDVSEEINTPKSSGKFNYKKTQPGKFVTSTTPEYENETTDYRSEGSDEQTEQYNEDDIHSGEIETKPEEVGPTRQPGYVLQQTTEKQEYDENITEDAEEIPALNKQVKNKSNRYLPDSRKELQKERSGSEYSEINSSKPNYAYVSSTTQKPFRKSNRPGSKRPSQEEEEHIQFATTYEPTDTSSTEEDYTSYTTRPKYTSKSRRPFSKPIKEDSFDSTEVPSRPIFDHTDEAVTSGSPTIRPGILESTFDVPSSTPTSIKTSVYSTVMPITKTNQPDTRNTSSNYYTKTKPSNFSSTSKTPDRLSSGIETESPDAPEAFGQSGPQNLPSTTYRPNYSIMDISEPESVTVDQFGRPLQVMSGTRQKVPQFGYSAANEGTTSGPQNVYQDLRVTRPQPGSPVDRFKPTEPRFGGPVQTTPGTKPAEFGPSTMTPGYLTPEKVIGEDFRGPKQQPKFDPETGYYY